MRSRATTSLLCALALLPGCSGGSERQEGGPERPPTLVEVASGREGTLRVERTYLGTVRSVARAELAAGASGEVLEVAVREGDRVEPGQVLLRIDPGLARSELSAAQASAQRTRREQEQASRDAERFEQAGPDTVAQVEIDRAAAQASALEAQERSVRAQVARARQVLSRHQVVAPFAGVISARRVDPGDWVEPGTLALELVADSETEILARVEPELLEDVEVGTEATLRLGEREAPARVVGVVRALDPVTRTAQLRLRPTEAAPFLWAGSAVDVHFALERGGGGVIVPRDALVEGARQTRVVRVVDGEAQPITVEVLERGREEVRVRGEGLSADDALVVRGNDRLRPGQPVSLAERVAAP